jgi:hypothetical protein
MSAFADLVAEVLDTCQQAPEPLVERHIRNAVIAFCSRTLLLRKDLSAISIIADQYLYQLNPPAGREIVEVRSAQIGEDSPLIERSEDYFDLQWRDPVIMRSDFCCTDDDGNVISTGDDWRQYTQNRPQFYFIDRTENTYRMRLVGIPIASLTDTLAVNVVLKPSRTATEVDDWLLSDHFQCLLHGAKARMLELPKRPWTDLQLAGYHNGLFEEATEMARMKGQRSHIRNDQTNRRVKAYV